ncbi:hypothetical protein BDF20DRAFT_832861 [Mycotypha africana]|uniref:uncharacterized protein n=1 Tax=Mycotypha africana TaxID=64632 RepID=UPI002300ABBB|nr:uncharacterized protein BDF20DRAFT_832861 [Mycotypha africana]KAI8987976.1 hypothetical protein BDF20DRAFT_832861 [Mycotypha africana]
MSWIKSLKNQNDHNPNTIHNRSTDNPPASKSAANTSTANINNFNFDNELLHPYQQTSHSEINDKPPTIRIRDDDGYSTTEDDRSSIRSKTASLISRHLKKDHLNLFHMPHGFIKSYLRHGHRRHSSDDSASSKVPASSAATIAGLTMTPADEKRDNYSSYNRNNSKVAHHQHSSSGLLGNQWAHHRHSFSDSRSRDYSGEEGENMTQQRRRSNHAQNGSRRPSSTHTGDLSDRADSNQTWHSRESSVFSLPEYVDSPEIGFQKLQKDGDLVDWDELSTFLREEEVDREGECELPEWKVDRTFTRTLVNNELIRLALNGLFLSPIQIHSKKHVLHVGCGKGLWCSNTASLFPNWLVVGMDDVTGGPCPDQRKVPKNFKYIRCYYDILRTMHDIPSESFDFIYVRFLLDSYSEDEYKTLIQECKRICKPHGYVEFHEMDMRIYGSPRPGPCTHKLNGKVFQIMERHNINPRLARKLSSLVQNIFEREDQKPSPIDTREMLQKKQQRFYMNYTSLPIGKWGGKLGVLFRDAINDLYLDIKMHECADSDVSYEGSVSSLSDAIPYDSDIETMARELESRKAFMNIYHVYVRKSSVH